jgi:hypothetical protein
VTQFGSGSTNDVKALLHDPGALGKRDICLILEPRPQGAWIGINLENSMRYILAWLIVVPLGLLAVWSLFNYL